MSSVANHYELLRKIATGETSEIFLARRHGAAGFVLRCVVKKLRPELREDTKAVAQFLDEARAVATLQHRNIVQVLDLGRNEGGFFAAMELVDGPSLRRLMASLPRGGAPPAPLVAWIVARVASALHFAHMQRDPISDESMGLCHGHLQPAMILLSRDGHVKVTGFTTISLGGKHARTVASDIAALGSLLAGLVDALANPELSDIAASAQGRGRRRIQTAHDVAIELDRWLISHTVTDAQRRLGVFVRDSGASPFREESDATWKQRAAGAQQHSAEAAEPDTAPSTARRAVFQTRQLRVFSSVLPPRPGRFFGGRGVLQRVIQRFKSGSRAVSLGGVAGVGKSRVAWELAHLRAESGGTAWVVDLVEAARAPDAAAAIAAAIALPGARGAPHEVATHVSQLLAGSSRPLLVLDDIDALVDEVDTLIDGLLAGNDELQLLLTTRRRVAHADVATVIVQPLPLPPDDKAAAKSELVRFFVDRARRAEPGYFPDRAHISQILALAQRLDGIPLALEMAAAQIGHRTLQDILRDLDRGFEPLEGPRKLGKRERSLRRAMALSWARLPMMGRLALSQMVIFRGGFDMEAAEAIIDVRAAGKSATTRAAIDLLVAHSMVRELPSAGERSRWSVFESMRHFVYQQPTGHEERDEALPRYQRHYIEEANRNAALLHTHDSIKASEWLGSERDNLLTTHRRALREAGNRAQGVREALEVTAALAPFMTSRGPMTTLIQLFQTATAHHDALAPSEQDKIDPKISGNAFARQAEVIAISGRANDALNAAERGLERAIASGDELTIGRAQYSLGVCYRLLGRSDEAMTATTRAREIAKKHGALGLEAAALNIMGSALYDLSERHVAAKCFTAGLAAARQVGYQELASQLVTNLGCVCVEQGNTDRALAHFHDALASARADGATRLVGSLHMYMAVAAQERGDMGLSRMHYQRAIDIYERVGFLHRKVYVRGLLALHDLEAKGADALQSAAQTFSDIIGEFVDKGDWRWRSVFTASLALTEQINGRPDSADNLLDEALRWGENQHDPAALGFYEVIAAGCELHRANAAGADSRRLKRQAKARLESVRMPRQKGAGGRSRPPLWEVCCEVRIAARILAQFGLSGA